MSMEDKLFVKLRKVSQANLTRDTLIKLEEEIFQIGNDRAFVLVFTALVEDSLRNLLLSHMNKDLNSDDRRRIFEYEGLAGSFSSRTMLAWAMGIIGKDTRHDLDLIRKLRNEFAHSRVSFNFETDEVKAICALLRIPEHSSTPFPFRYATHLQVHGRDEELCLEHTKTRFATTCHLISYRIYQCINGPQEGDIAFKDGPLLP